MSIRSRNRPESISDDLQWPSKTPKKQCIAANYSPMRYNAASDSDHSKFKRNSTFNSIEDRVSGDIEPVTGFNVEQNASPYDDTIEDGKPCTLHSSRQENIPERCDCDRPENWASFLLWFGRHVEHFAKPGKRARYFYCPLNRCNYKTQTGEKLWQHTVTCSRLIHGEYFCPYERKFKYFDKACSPITNRAALGTLKLVLHLLSSFGLIKISQHRHLIKFLLTELPKSPTVELPDNGKPQVVYGSSPPTELEGLSSPTKILEPYSFVAPHGLSSPAELGPSLTAELGPSLPAELASVQTFQNCGSEHSQYGSQYGSSSPCSGSQSPASRTSGSSNFSSTTVSPVSSTSGSSNFSSTTNDTDPSLLSPDDSKDPGQWRQVNEIQPCYNVVPEFYPDVEFSGVQYHSAGSCSVDEELYSSQLAHDNKQLIAVATDMKIGLEDGFVSQQNPTTSDLTGILERISEQFFPCFINTANRGLNEGSLLLQELLENVPNHRAMLITGFCVAKKISLGEVSFSAIDISCFISTKFVLAYAYELSTVSRDFRTANDCINDCGAMIGYMIVLMHDKPEPHDIANLEAGFYQNGGCSVHYTLSMDALTRLATTSSEHTTHVLSGFSLLELSSDFLKLIQYAEVTELGNSSSLHGLVLWLCNRIPTHDFDAIWRSLLMTIGPILNHPQLASLVQRCRILFQEGVVPKLGLLEADMTSHANFEPDVADDARRGLMEACRAILNWDVQDSVLADWTSMCDIANRVGKSPDGVYSLETLLKFARTDSPNDFDELQRYESSSVPRQGMINQKLSERAANQANSRQSKRQRRSPRSVASDRSTFFCGICQKNFRGKAKNAKSNMKRHMRELHSDKPPQHQCPTCGHNYSRSGNLKSHVCTAASLLPCEHHEDKAQVPFTS